MHWLIKRRKTTLQRRYFLSVGLALGVLIINALYIYMALQVQEEHATQINIAGRQRMISQRLMLEVIQYQNHELPLEIVKATATVWKNGHAALLDGNTALDIAAVSNQEIHANLTQLSPVIDSVSDIIIHLEKDESLNTYTLAQTQSNFLTKMDGLVNDLEMDARYEVRKTLFIEICLLIASMVMLLLDLRYIYIPIIHRLSESNQQMEAQRVRYESLIDSTTDGIFLMDVSGKLIAMNRAAKDFLIGSISATALPGHDLLSLIPPLWKRAIQIAKNKVLQGETVRAEISTPIQDVNHWLLVSLYPVYNNQQELIGIALNLVDINRQKGTEFYIKKQNKTLREIAARQSHDLRGRLASILGLIQVIKIEDDEGVKLQMVEHLEPLANQMDEVIHDIVAQTQFPQSRVE